MLDTVIIGKVLVKTLSVVIGFGYSVLAFLIYRQVMILSKILGTNLGAFLKSMAILHLVIVVVGFVVIFLLI